MDIQVLTQADRVMSRCGRPTYSTRGVASTYISKGFMLQAEFAEGTASSSQTIELEITGDTWWCLRGIMATGSPGTAITIQVLKPDGTFLINTLQDVLQALAGYGSYTYAFSNMVRCEPGSKIQVTLVVTNTGSFQPIAIFFTGAYEYLLKGGAAQICPVDEIAQQIPRYFSHPNQNQFAPAWQHGIAPAITPPGFEDEDFTYAALGPETAAFPAGSPGSTLLVTAANPTALQQIGMDASEFHCQRILVLVSADETVTSGRVLAKVRAGSGYSITDDYIDLEQYLSSVRWPMDWVIDPNDTIYADLQLVDQAGTGNVYWTLFLQGFKRRRKL